MDASDFPQLFGGRDIVTFELSDYGDVFLTPRRLDADWTITDFSEFARKYGIFRCDVVDTSVTQFPRDAIFAESRSPHRGDDRLPGDL